MRVYISLILIVFTFAKSNAQGLIISDSSERESYNQLPKDKFGFAEYIPNSFSLEKYVPPVLMQKGGTCVGFASFYYGLTTMYNAKFGITNTTEKYAHAFDPYFLYSLIYNEIDDCSQGLNFYNAFSKLSNIGAKKLLFPPFTNCGTKWTRNTLTNTVGYTTPYKIENFYVLEITDPKILPVLKELLYEIKIPIIVGFSVVESLYPYSSENLNGVKSDGLWEPNPMEREEGGHALCVVGYDDYKFGGSFRIVNSWGPDYGDNGYLWIKYKDFFRLAKEGYILELNKNLVLKPPYVIDDESYTRFNFENKIKTTSSYEGQYLYDGINGLGIWSDKVSNSYFAGRYENGKMEGFFIIIDNDGIYSANAVNGELQNIEKMGFADNTSQLENQKELKDYFENLGNKVSPLRPDDYQTIELKKQE